METYQRSVIVGASSGVGRALAARLAAAGHDLVLAARGERDLDAVAGDLRLRHGTRVHVLPIDLSREELDTARFLEACLERLGEVDALFLTAARMDPQDEGLLDPERIGPLVRVNTTHALRILARFGRRFETRGTGCLVVFSSIAAAVPRRRNTVYASTKAALETYCRGLRHHFAGSGVRVQVWALGYVDTALSFGQKLLFPAVSPDRVADHVVRRLGEDRGVVYYPAFWLAVVLILRHLPWFVYRRLKF